MRTFACAIITAAALMYITSVAFWISQWPYLVLSRVSDDASANDALREYFPKAGIYMLPDIREKTEELPQLYEQGPIATIFIQPQGSPILSWRRHVGGIFHFLLLGSFLTVFLNGIQSSITRVRHQVGLPAVAGIAAVLLCDTTGALWFYQDATWHLVNGLYHWTTWFLGSLTIIAFLKGPDSFLFRTFTYLQTSFSRPESSSPSAIVLIASRSIEDNGRNPRQISSIGF